MLKPQMTEKTMGKVETQNEYTFQVSRFATKDQIRRLVEQAFGVKVASVRTKVTHGKTKRYGKKRTEITGLEKKHAIVRLKDKGKIAIFETKGAEK